MPSGYRASRTSSGLSNPKSHMWNGPVCKAFFHAFTRLDGAVICPAYLWIVSPLATMISAKQIA